MFDLKCHFLAAGTSNRHRTGISLSPDILILVTESFSFVLGQKRYAKALVKGEDVLKSVI